MASDAFAEMVELTQDHLYGSMYTRTGRDRDATAEILQETYYRANRSLPKFRGDAQDSTWLHRISFNQLSNYYRTEARHTTRTMPVGLYHDGEDGINIEQQHMVDETFDADTEMQAVVAELNEDLLQALKDLTPKHRTVWCLRNVLDWSHTQIATHQGITENASKVRLHRAIKRLREHFNSTD